MPRRPRNRAGSAMATTALAWDQTPEYLSSCNREIPQGGRDTYVVLEDNEDERVSSTDVTSFIFGQAEWCEENLPNIAYILEPSDEWKAFLDSPPPEPKRDSRGRLMYEASPEPGKMPKPLLDYRQLPDKISTAVHWFRLELWRRYDGRIQWEDILTRMEQPRPSQTSLQMRTSRGRTRFSMIAWHGHHNMHLSARPGDSNNKPISNTAQQVIDSLSVSQIMTNTTRGSTPGLVNPDLGELGGRIPVPTFRTRSTRYHSRIRPARRLHAAGLLDADCVPSSSQILKQNSMGPNPDHDQSRMYLDEANDSTDTEVLSVEGGYPEIRESDPSTISAVIEDPKTGASEHHPAFKQFIRSGIASFPYIPVPGLEFQNFIESLFARQTDNNDANAIGQVAKLPSSSSQRPQGENPIGGPLPLNQLNCNNSQHHDSASTPPNIGTGVADTIDFRNIPEGIPDLFIGDPHLNGMINSVYETLFDEPSSTRSRNAQPIPTSFHPSRPTGSFFQNAGHPQDEKILPQSRPPKSAKRPFHPFSRSPINKIPSIDYIESNRRQRSSRRSLCREILKGKQPSNTRDWVDDRNFEDQQSSRSAPMDEVSITGENRDHLTNEMEDDVKESIENREDGILHNSMDGQKRTWLSTPHTSVLDTLSMSGTTPQEPDINAPINSANTSTVVLESEAIEVLPDLATEQSVDENKSEFIDEFFDMDGYQGQS